MQERKDKRIVGLYARRGMPEGKDERIAGLSFRKGKVKRVAQKNAAGVFQRVIKGREFFQIMELQLIRLDKQTGKIEHIRGQRFPARK